MLPAAPNSKGETNLQSTGQCQCGKIKYYVQNLNYKAYFCHCRLCQKALGNIFATFLNIKKNDLTWLTDLPEYYKSSKNARRGFCSHCGTPICYEPNSSERMDLTVGSLNQAMNVSPVGHTGVENRLKNFVWDDELPKYTTLSSL